MKSRFQGRKEVKSMMNLCCAFIVIWFVCSIFVLLWFAIESENKNILITESLKCFIADIFSDKNWFGILLDIVICILLIPTYLYILIIKAVYVIGKVCVYIWKLGIKN